MAFFTRNGCSFVPNGKALEACNDHDIRYKNIWLMRKADDEDFLFNMLFDGVWKVKAYLYYYGARILGRLVV